MQIARFGLVGVQEFSAKPMSLLPLLLAPVVFALLFKAAAFLYGRLQVSSLHAFLFGLLATLVSGLAALIKTEALSGHMPASLFGIAGIVVQSVLAGWYFGPRATTASGMLAGFGRGVVLALIAFGLVFAAGFFAAIVLPASRT